MSWRFWSQVYWSLGLVLSIEVRRNFQVSVSSASNAVDDADGNSGEPVMKGIE